MGTVLIVDDEEDLRYSLAKIVAKQGYRATCAATGADALDILRSAIVDLVFLDIGLPDGNGIDLIGAINEIGEQKRLFDHGRRRFRGFATGGKKSPCSVSGRWSSSISTRCLMPSTTTSLRRQGFSESPERRCETACNQSNFDQVTSSWPVPVRRLGRRVPATMAFTPYMSGNTTFFAAWPRVDQNLHYPLTRPCPHRRRNYQAPPDSAERGCRQWT